MSILKYKYKAHKLINYVFYVIVFLVGFFIGFGSKEINFSKLISQVLMIDNAKAYTLYSSNTLTIDEEYIYNTFTSNFSDFNIENYPNIFCSKWFPNSKPTIYCYAMDNTSANSFYYAGASGSSWKWRFGNDSNYSPNPMYMFAVRLSDGVLSNIYYQTNMQSFLGSPSITATYNSFSNFDITGASINVLDFSEYQIPDMVYNENLFKDNSNFKEVCIEKGKKYGITTTNIDPISNTAFVSDFIWFPGKIIGVKYSEYDSLNDNNILIFNDDVSTENYYFEDKDKIDSFYNDEIISNYFNNSGYTDKYSYYGYTAYKFMHSYYVDENDNPQNMFTIFDFTDIDYSSTNSGGGAGTPFGLNDNTSLNYCFYIKNEFSVTELKTDEWNDYTGVVPTPGGDLDVNTSHNKNNANTEDFLSQPKNFIISMKDTINLINSLVYEFYISLPALLRTFIITALIILIIILIMKIGGYK